MKRNQSKIKIIIINCYAPINKYISFCFRIPNFIGFNIHIFIPVMMINRNLSFDFKHIDNISIFIYCKKYSHTLKLKNNNNNNLTFNYLCVRI